MKWFRSHPILLIAFAAAIAASTTLALRVARVRALAGHYLTNSTLQEWIQNTEAGSSIESALYRLMHLPTGDVLYNRSPRETRPELTTLIRTSGAQAALYSLRALQEEQALDFTAAEADWKSWVEHAPDRIAAELDLADFYHRRLRPQDEIAALMTVAQSPAPPSEKLTASSEQRSWKAFERILVVAQENALGAETTSQTYREWIARYPAEPALYSRFFDELLNQKQYDEASALITQYSKAFPSDAVFPIKAQASLAYRRGSVAEGLAIYDKAFQPLWPPELIQSYFNLLKETRSLPAFLDRTRAKLSANPDDLNSAARLFYAYQQQGRLDAAKQAIADYRQSKESRNAPWTAQELYVFARLLEAVQAYPESARYYFALNNISDKTMPETQQRAYAGLIAILLDAPEQPLRLGAGNLSIYRDIATMDQGPGYLNGILSLFLNTTDPRGEYATEDQLATPYFHRARAAELLTQFDTRFANDPERAALHVRLIHAYGVYGEDEAVIRAGKEFLAQFPKDHRRVDVALTVADSYARTNRTSEEFAIYAQLLRELASQAEGVPLGDRTLKYSKPVEGQQAIASQEAPSDADQPPDQKPAAEQAFATQTTTAAVFAVRSPQYEQVLDRYLARLVATQQLPQALAVMRGELDHDPNDPGIYEKLAGFLQQNQLGAHEEEVYRRAIQQFDDQGWYAKLARYFIRQKRNADYSALTAQVTKIFSGTELESYFASVPAPNAELSVQVNLYAHQRFPHDLTFTQNLLTLYRQRMTYNAAAWQKLLAEHWFEDANLRSQFFEHLAKTGKLEPALATLREQDAEIAKEDWTALARSNPAAARFLVESQLWQSHFEECAPVAAALSAEYPADFELGSQASSLYRSLAYFNAADTARAAAIEKRLLDFDPGNLDMLARVGDIYADREHFSEAAPYWFRMAEVHPGLSDGYLQSATIFWDYFDFDSALSQLQKGRQKLANPTLYSYETGAIYENQRDYPKAIAQYVQGAIANQADGESRSRLLALARRPAHAQQVNDATAGLLSAPNPSVAQISLRVEILTAQRHTAELAAALTSLLDRLSSFDVLEYVDQVAREQSLVQVQQHSLERQIAITTDPTHRMELRYDLVRFYESNRLEAAAQNEIDALYRENPKILGVIRSTVDYDWSHDRKPQAVTVLEEAARASYPDLAQQFNFEAARKLTELGQYAQARALLDDLLKTRPYDGPYLTAVADTYGRAGDNAGLRDFYQAKIAVLKTAPLDRAEKTDRIAALQRGLIPALTRLKDPSAAVDQYIELINAYPGDEGLVSEAALYAARYQQQSRLLDFYRKTVAESPRDSRWSIVLARLETTLEDYPAAIDAYSKAIVIRPDRVDLYTARAELNQKLQHYDEAIADYEKLYTLAYKDPAWLENVAETRARQGKSQLVVAALQAALIDGRPAKPADYFEAARRLESWNMLDEARSFAEKGIGLAGSDLLANSANHSGAVLYTRILTRQRRAEDAYAKLAAALTAAAQAPGLSATFKQVEQKGIAAVTNEEWREQQRQMRLSAGREGFAASLKEMASTAHTYYTPEETQALVQLLRSKSAAASDDDLTQFFLPAAESGSLTLLKADWEWKLSASHENSMWVQWAQLQRDRLLLGPAAKQLESAVSTIFLGREVPVYTSIADLDRDNGDHAGELRALEKIATFTELDGELRDRYFSLLLAQKPQTLVDLSQKAQGTERDAAAQYTLLNGPVPLALEAVKARGADLPPVWTLGYTATAGLYLHKFDASTGDAFQAALGDATIGERIGKPVDRNRQLAGALWFYYGARYGEYLGLTDAAASDDYLPASLELQPESSSAYEQLASWYGEQGKLSQALEEYNLALQLQPNSATIYDRIALLLWKQNKKPEALDAWKKAVTLVVKEIDKPRVPQNFWTDFSTIIGHLGSRGQFATVRPQVDAMLHTYIRRNGSYMTDTLLRAIFKADNNPADATSWIIELSAVGDPPNAVLDSIAYAPWIPDTQRPRIYARLVDIARESVASTQGDERTQAVDRLRQLQVQWLQSLIKIDDYAGVKQQLDGISVDEKKSHQAEWLPLEIKLAAHNGTLATFIEQWTQSPGDAPPARLLRDTSSSLDKASKNLILAFVYQSAIDAHDLAATNFLGLAEIRIDNGDVSGAVALLQRMILVSSDQYVDLDSAASLLTRKSRDAAAIPFLVKLAAGVPWQPAYRLRLDIAKARANQADQATWDDLSMLAKNPLASYEVRAQASLAVAGKAPPHTLGSAELDILARGTISVAEAQRPYFLIARLQAAKTAPLPQRSLLFRQVIETAPQNDAARLQLLQAALEQKDAHLAINASARLFNLSNVSSGNDQPTYQESVAEEDGEAEQTPENPGSESEFSHGASAFNKLPPAERVTLLNGIAESYRDINDPQQALSYFRQALRLETDPARRKLISANIANLRRQGSRDSINAQRAPQIHASLDQNHPVRPRLLAAGERTQP